MRKWSWIAVASFSFALAVIGIYLENDRIETETGRASSLFTIRTSSERRADRIEAELDRPGMDRSWAGRYYSGDGLGFNMSLLIAPDAGYVFTRFGDGGPWSESEDGSFGVRDGVVYSHRSDEHILQHGLRPVRWGRRFYMIPVDELVDFANEINYGFEPRSDVQGAFLLRNGAEKLVTSGFPELPAEASAYLRARPLDARITAVGGDLTLWTDFGSGIVFIRHETTVLMNVGRRQGALPGLALHPRSESAYGKALIVHANENSSVAVFRRDDYFPPPARGWEMSTRMESERGYSSLDEPLEIIGKPTSRVHFPVLGAEAASVAQSRADLELARKSGVTAIPLAHVVIAAVSRGILDSDEMREKRDALLHGFGANAYVTVKTSEK
jgi:hypothetical protein